MGREDTPLSIFVLYYTDEHAVMTETGLASAVSQKRAEFSTEKLGLYRQCDRQVLQLQDKLQEAGDGQGRGGKRAQAGVHGHRTLALSSGTLPYLETELPVTGTMPGCVPTGHLELTADLLEVFSVDICEAQLREEAKEREHEPHRESPGSTTAIACSN